MRVRGLWPWLALALLGGAPFLMLMAAGGWWLWQEHRFWMWLSVSVSCSGVAWILARLLKRRRERRHATGLVLPQFALSQLDAAVWGEVAALAEQAKQDKSFQVDELEHWLWFGRRILAAVAKHYRPNAKHPELEIPATELLIIMERVSRDMREQLHANLPFSHVLTLADGLNLQRWLEHLDEARTAVRLGRLLLNPFAGILNEAKNYAQDKAAGLTLPLLRNWLLDTYAQKVGEYAILLYSGRLKGPPERGEALSEPSRLDLRQAEARQEGLAAEPLRILTAGQTKAGKSTLINALFGRPRAATDVIACTAALTPYKLDQNGELSGLIFDTPGYGENTQWISDNQRELDKTDLLLLVCNANNAARAADRGFLTAFQRHFTEQAKRKMPPVIVVATHIDQLRPMREWSPPYNLNPPDSDKARNILAALDAIREDLPLPADTPLAAVCLGDSQGRADYNVEAIIAAMGRQMNAANQARLLRCLGDTENQDKWRQVWRQGANSGRWFLRGLGKILP